MECCCNCFNGLQFYNDQRFFIMFYVLLNEKSNNPVYLDLWRNILIYTINCKPKQLFPLGKFEQPHNKNNVHLEQYNN